MEASRPDESQDQFEEQNNIDQQEEDEEELVEEMEELEELDEEEEEEDENATKNNDEDGHSKEPKTENPNLVREAKDSSSNKFPSGSGLVAKIITIALALDTRSCS
jgi:hypothetical protein